MSHWSAVDVAYVSITISVSFLMIAFGVAVLIVVWSAREL